MTKPSHRETSAPQDAPPGVLGGPPAAEGPELSRIASLTIVKPLVHPALDVIDETNVHLAPEDEGVLDRLLEVGKEDRRAFLVRNGVRVAEARDLKIALSVVDGLTPAIRQVAEQFNRLAIHAVNLTATMTGNRMHLWRRFLKTPHNRALRRYIARTERVPRHGRLKPRHGAPRGHR